MSLKKIAKLLALQMRLELRSKASIGAIFLFSVVLIFIAFKAFNQFSTMSWNVLYWLLLVLGASTAVLKSFVPSESNLDLYYYTIVDPIDFIVSKILYNFLFLFVLSNLNYLLFIYFSFDAVLDHSSFLINQLLICLGLSIVFSFVSAVASKERNAAVLSSILGLPMILPILLLGIKISAHALGILANSNITQDLLLLFGIDMLLFGLILLLFPTLWKA